MTSLIRSYPLSIIRAWRAPMLEMIAVQKEVVQILRHQDRFGARAPLRTHVGTQCSEYQDTGDKEKNSAVVCIYSSNLGCICQKPH